MELRHGLCGTGGYFKMVILCIAVWGVCGLLCGVDADFDGGDVSDDYTLDVGPKTDCPEDIELSGNFNKLLVKADEVEVNGEECESSSGPGEDAEMQLKKDPSGSYASRVLNASDEVRSFLNGNITKGTFECGGLKFTGDEEWLLMKPMNEWVVKISDLFGRSDTPLQTTANIEEFTFEKDEKYVILGIRCIYREKKLSDRICFSGDATVQMQVRDGDGDGVGTKQVAMRDVRIGDMIVTDSVRGRVEPVLGFSHASKDVKARFIEAYTSTSTSTLSAEKLVATPGHFVYARTARDGFGSERLVQMRDLKVGDRLSHASGEERAITRIVQRTLAQGTWNPHTHSGVVEVDGFKASCYTAAVTPVAAHALLTPLRSAAGRVVSAVWRAFSVGCAMFQSS